MLPARHRMHRRSDFETAVRRGHRGGSRRLVVHYGCTAPPATPPLVGFVVSRAVGGAVERNRVKRRLRGLMASRVTELPDSALVVVRALPAAAGASSDELGRDLAAALRAACRPATGSGQ